MVFHPDDIPKRKVQNRTELKEWKKERSKALGVAERWDTSVPTNPDPIPHRRTRTCSVHDRYARMLTRIC